MVIDSSATLIAQSTTITAAAVTEKLGLTPTRAYEVGQTIPRRSGQPGRRTAAHAQWEHTLRSSATAEDPHGLAALRRLVELLLPSAPALLELGGTCDLRIFWLAHSDSPQGGFVLDGLLLAGLGRLGIPFYADVFLSSTGTDA